MHSCIGWQYVSKACVSLMLIKYHANYLITTDDVHTLSWPCHIWYFTHHKMILLFIYNTCNICHGIYIYIYLHNAKGMMKYKTRKIVANYMCRPDHLSRIIQDCCWEWYPKRVSFSFIIRINVVLI